MENKVIEIKISGVTKFAPCYVINGENTAIYWRGELLYYDTEEEAQEYLNDE